MGQLAGWLAGGSWPPRTRAKTNDIITRHVHTRLFVPLFLIFMILDHANQYKHGLFSSGCEMTCVTIGLE